MNKEENNAALTATLQERERERERERESGAVGATSTPSTVGSFSFLTMLFLPTFSQH